MRILQNARDGRARVAAIAGVALLLGPLLAIGTSRHVSDVSISPALAVELNAQPLAVADAASETPRGKTITVDYPENGSIFPPDITAPTFLWRDTNTSARTWRIEIKFADGSAPLRTESRGEGMKIGEIDPRCVSENNRPPSLTEKQAAAHTWTPDVETWKSIKAHSVEKSAVISIVGLDAESSGTAISSGAVTLLTSKDPVGAPIFYRDVPLMPSVGEKNIVQPLAPASIYLINWRVRDIGQTSSRVVMHDMHTCANCHSFSRDGQTMGIDVDGPKNDKGLYAVVPVAKQMTIRNSDMVSWNSDLRVGKSRIGFMSQVSPDGKYVLSTFAGLGQDIPSSYTVTNFKDYRFLQVFYPTRGILAWYDRASGRRHTLPGADDPRYVQTDGVWSPDGKYIVFARAEAKDPSPPGAKPALYANDPNEIQIQYSLYRMPFNGGMGGVPEPITGASNNGMSNNFPKISPDGRWIVFVKNKNGQLMRPDSELYMVPSAGGVARKMRCNTSLMNSWHSFSPNGRWLVFSSKSRSPYTQMFLTHIDESGQDSPPIYIENSTAANRAVNLPEFVNTTPDGLQNIDVPASDFYRLIDQALAEQQKGDNPAALSDWKKAVEIDPNDARSNNGMAIALTVAGNSDDAVKYFKKAVAINENFYEAYYNLGLQLIKQNQLAGAVDAWQQAVRIRPDFAPAHENLGYAYYLQGEFAQSLNHLRLALQSEPDRVSVLNLAASLLATCPDASVRNGTEAVVLATRAKEITQGKDSAILDTLSAAYAEAGRFSEAIDTERQAIALATEQRNLPLANTLSAHLDRYGSKVPLREPPDPVSF